MGGTLVRRLAGRVEREAEEDEPATPGSGSAAWAFEVIRPPNDLPPAKSGRPGISRRRFAPRRAPSAVASGGRSGRRLFASM